MAGSRQVQRAAVIGGFAAIAAIVAFMALMQLSNAQNVAFKQSWDSIGFEAIALTKEYQAEEGRWKAGQHSNATMADIVDRYLPRYQQLIDRAETLETPEKYADARDLLVRSLEAEKQSNERFKQYLLTGDRQEYEKALDLFSLSLKYSAEADAAVSAAG